MTQAEPNVLPLLAPVRKLHERVREAVLASCRESEVDNLARVADDGSAGDTIYAIDRIGEESLIEAFESEIGRMTSFVLIGEGFKGGQTVLPRGATESDAVWRVIVDPIDGTRGLMFQKRSAWILTGVAPNRGRETSLRDIVLAVQTEIPLLKQYLCDSMWAIKGYGAHAERYNQVNGERRALRLQPSKARSIRHGFAAIARFFPGAREELAAIDEEIVIAALGSVEAGKAHCFEDQYPSTGGQLYELVAGHDRFIADLRPLMQPILKQRGLALGLCCHPYDLCTELIAREIGVIVADPLGGPLCAPLDLESNIAWAGYANDHIREEIEPLMQRALERRGLLV
jgi:hypothetical protein